MSKPLSGVALSVTGVNSSEEKFIRKSVRSLGGTFEPNLTHKTSCLIVKKVGSAKYKAACDQLGTPTITTQWLKDCESRGELLGYDDYKAPPFMGLTVCCTQVEPEDRASIQESVEANGGIFSADLVDEVCTHLVAVEAKGDKYNAAKQWGNVHIVSPAWIEECVKRDRWVQELPYLIVLNSNVTATAQNQHFEPLPREEMKIPMTSTATAELEESKKTPPPTPLALDWSTLPNVDKIPDERRGILRRDIFFISGFDQVQADYLIGLVLAGGGARHYVLTTSVTKVLLGPEASERLTSEVFKHPCGAACVKVDWLVETMVPGHLQKQQLATLEEEEKQGVEAASPHRRDLQDSLDYFNEGLNVRAQQHDLKRMSSGSLRLQRRQSLASKSSTSSKLKRMATDHGNVGDGGRAPIKRQNSRSRPPVDESQFIDWCEE